VLSFAVSSTVLGTAFIIGGRGLQLQRYLGLLGIYGAGSAAFVMSRIRGAKVQLFEFPVYLTIMFFIQFGLAPLRNFLDPSQIDVNLSADGTELVQALAYVILGMVAFWIGSEVFRRRVPDRASPHTDSTHAATNSHKTSLITGFWVLFIVGFGVRFYLLRNNLFAYTGSSEKYFENLSTMQVMNVLGEDGTLALIIPTIEWYRKQEGNSWKMLFILAFSTEVMWGLLSGMKSLVLQNFLLVALISSFIMRKLNLRWFALLFFGLIILYPISKAYRAVVSGGGEVLSFGGAVRAGRTALKDMGEGETSTGDFGREGLANALQRMDLLTSVAQILTLGDRADMVRGDVQWWTLPFYPFVPRFLWPSKPILIEGGRFTAALAGGSASLSNVSSSTAVTYPGDLYLQFGLLGVPIGMFIFGLVTQWVTSRVSGSAEPRELFLYTAIFILGFWYETDAFAMWTGFIKMLAILYFVRLLIYGQSAQRKNS
jgi:hypothetical protein